MYAQRGFLVGFLVLAVLSTALIAQEAELKLGQIRESALSPSQTHSFIVLLN